MASKRRLRQVFIIYRGCALQDERIYRRREKGVAGQGQGTISRGRREMHSLWRQPGYW